MGKAAEAIGALRNSRGFRWAALLPAALLGGGAVFFLARLIVWLGFAAMFDTRSQLFRMLNEGVSSLGFGAAFISIGVLCAPGKKRATIYGLGGLALAVGASAALRAFRAPGADPLFLYSVTVALAGVAISAYSELRSLKKDR
jgi:hypothetical protein